MFCSKCGNTIDEGALFCNKCGAKVGDDANVNTNPISNNMSNGLVSSIKKTIFKNTKTKIIFFGAIFAVVLIVLINFLLKLRNPGDFTKSLYGEQMYKFRNGIFAKNEWVTHDGNEYYFNENGIMQRDKWVDSDYYVDANGVKRKNFFYEDGKNIYYLQEDGKYVRGGILDLNSKLYVFEDDGKLVRNTVWEMASPSYAVYVEKDGTIRKKLGYYDIDNGKTIYVNDEKTGKIARSEWVKNEKSGKFNFFNKDGEMVKGKAIIELNCDDMIQYAVYGDGTSVENALIKIILGVVDENMSLVNYYVDDEGNMLTNCFKTIDDLDWTFDNDGKASIDLWEQKNYTDTKKPYITNAKYIDGIYFISSFEKSKEAYLKIAVDKTDVAFFLCEGSDKKLIKNDYNYIDKNYQITMYSKVCSPSYKFTGTMYKKSNRIFVDQPQAITTILNHLNTGTGFVIRIDEADSNYPTTYEFYVEPQNFKEMYEMQFEYKNGWKGDSYYVNNFKVLNQWQEYNGDWYYLGPNGVILKDQWVDNEYYVDKEGKMLKNTTTPDGYKVDENGKYVEEKAESSNNKDNSEKIASDSDAR